MREGGEWKKKKKSERNATVIKLPVHFYLFGVSGLKLILSDCSVPEPEPRKKKSIPRYCARCRSCEGLYFVKVLFSTVRGKDFPIR